MFYFVLKFLIWILNCFVVCITKNHMIYIIQYENNLCYFHTGEIIACELLEVEFNEKYITKISYNF